MELEDKEEPNLQEALEVTELAELADEPGLEIISEDGRERWPRMAPLVVAASLIATGVILLGGHARALLSSPVCQPDDLTCTPPGLILLFVCTCIFGSSVIAGVEGIRGRRYGRWIFAAGATLGVMFVTRLLELWFLSGGH